MPAIVPFESLYRIGEPTSLASVSAVVMLLLVVSFHLRGVRGSRNEQLLLAIFLFGMPLVYLSSLARSPTEGWLGIELVGFGVFATLAALGFRRSAWF